MTSRKVAPKKAPPKTVEVTNTNDVKSVSLGPNYQMLAPGCSCEVDANTAKQLKGHPWISQ